MLAALLALQDSPVRFLPPAPLMVSGESLSTPGGYASPVLFDLNEDGVEDLVLGFMKGGGFEVRYGKQGREFSTPQRLMVEGVPARVDTGCCIGSVPVFVDVDGDGRADLVSGTYQQGLVVFRGLGEGNFAGAVPLVDKSHGIAMSPTFGDIDLDGDMDLVIGTQAGPVLLFLNEEGKFALRGPLTSQDKAIVAQHGGPALFDFDRDGVLDLLIGDVRGELLLFMGKGKGDYGAPRSVFPAFPRGPRPGINLKPFVCDWNGDGKPDILVGDFRPDSSPVVPLAAEAEAQIELLTMESSAAAFSIFQRTSELEKQALKEAGLTTLASATPEQRARYDAALERLTREDKQLSGAKATKIEAESRIATLRDQKPVEGTVWVLYGL